jgi:hypothetical protein
LQSILQRLQTIDFVALGKQWRISPELAYDLAPLALYDIVFYCDDSGSMAFEEDGERIEDLKFILDKVASVATLFDDDGISVRWMNSSLEADHICSTKDVQRMFESIRFNGKTPLGTNLDKKVIRPFLFGRGSINKPILCVAVTDGEPSGESKDTIINVIRNAKQNLARTPYGAGAFALQVAQVGTDARAQKFLGKLDNDPHVGNMVDCTSNYEMEAEEYSRKGLELTPELWLLKVCVGAVDPEYDAQDE